MIDDAQIESLLSSYTIEGPSSAWVEQFQLELVKKEKSPGVIKLAIIGLATLALGLGGARYAYQATRAVPSVEMAQLPGKPTNGFKPEHFAATTLKIPVTPVRSYDNVACKEIKDHRQQLLKENPVLSALVPKDYDITKSRLLTALADGHPWRSIESVFFRDSIPQGKDVPTFAIDSVVLDNPFLLGHLSYSFYGMYVDGRIANPKSFIEGCQQDLTPTALTLDGQNRCFRVQYQMSHRENFPTVASRFGGFGGKAEYRLVLANAFDLGLDYCVVYSAQSKGFDGQGRFDHVRKTAMYCTSGMEPLLGRPTNQIRYDGSESPNLVLDSLPAKLTVGLWRDRPQNINAVPDVRLELEITGTGEVSPNSNFRTGQ